MTCFLVAVVVDFFVVVLAGVLLAGLVVDLAAVVLVVRLDAVLEVVLDLLAVLGAALLVSVRDEAVAGSVAIASSRGADFFGIAARTSRTALVCCSSVIRNSWCPSDEATK